MEKLVMNDVNPDQLDMDVFDPDKFERDMIPVIKKGYLMKKKQKGLLLGRSKWQRRFVPAVYIDVVRAFVVSFIVHAGADTQCEMYGTQE